MKKRYSRKHICEAIAYWKKQLRKLNESVDSSSKLCLQLTTADQGGGSDDGTIFDSLDEFDQNGYAWTKEKLEDWAYVSKDADPETYEELYRAEFDNALDSLYSNIKRMSTDFTKDGEAMYDIGELDGNDGTWLQLRYATKDDIEMYS